MPQTFIYHTHIRSNLSRMAVAIICLLRLILNVIFAIADGNITSLDAIFGTY